MNCNKTTMFWAIQLYKTEEIFVLKYLGVKSRKSIESACKNLQIKCIVFPFECDTRMDAEYKVYKLFNLDYDDSGILDLKGE